MPTSLVVFALVLLFLPISDSGRVQRALMDLCHGPLFFSLAVGICWTFAATESRRTRAIWVWALLVLLGVLTEVCQQWFGRQASAQDALANTLGTTAGVLACDAQLFRARWRMYLLSCGLLLAAMAAPIGILADAACQAWQLPILASFESPLELSRWSRQNSQIERTRQHATAGNWSLRVDLEPSRYPGVSIAEVPQDWTTYREFAFDVTLESPETLSLIVKLTDEAHNWESEDRFHFEAKLNTGLNRIRIPMRDIQHAPKGRLMDLSQMRLLQFFAIEPKSPATIYLDNIRLIPDDETASPYRESK